MVQKKVVIERLTPLNGASGGLRQKTARVTLRLEGDWRDWTGHALCLTRDLAALLPREYANHPGWHDLSDLHRWTTDYLETSDRNSLFARAVAALTVAIQREALDPVWCADITQETVTHVHLALPYERVALLKAALLWAMRLLVADGESERRSHLFTQFHEWLASVRTLAPKLFRLAMAAHASRVPFRIDASELVLGWGQQQTRLRVDPAGTSSLPPTAEKSPGNAADVAGETLNTLYARRPARIPVAAITGTNGKTTTARMLHHIWCVAGKHCGVNSTQGIWVGRKQVTRRNLSGQPGASYLLKEPSLEAAVLEMPRRGLIYFGHPCDRYDVAALLNVEDDHIGTDGIESVEQMAVLKAEVLARAHTAAVVNADDPLCLAMLRHAGTPRHILVAHSDRNASVARHRKRGGEAVFIGGTEDARCIVLARGAEEITLMPLKDIPATLNGLLRFNESNALFAAALAWAQQIDHDTVRIALASFRNSARQNAGRFNFINSLPFTVLLDYAHNPAGMRGLMDVAASIDVPGKRVLVNSNGLRFQHHLAQELPLYPRVFDRIYIGPYEDYFLRASRGFDRTDPIGDMLAQARAMLTPQLRTGQTLHTLRSHVDALRAGLESCQPGDLLVMLCEPEDGEIAITEYQSRLQASMTPT